MTKAMHQMSYYLVIMFFIAQFVYAFGQSNLGVLLALKGAAGLQAIRHARCRNAGWHRASDRHY